MALQDLVDGLLVAPNPLSCLVWNRELSDWTRAGAVPVVESRLSPFVTRPPDDPKTTQRIPVAADAGPGSLEAGPASSDTTAMGGPWLYLAGAAFVAFVAFGVWSMWPRGAPAPADTPGESPRLTTPAGPSGAATPTTTLPPADGGTQEAQPSGAATPTTTLPPADGGTQEAQPSSSPSQPAGLTEAADVESDLPRSAVPKLRGVAGWSGTKLTLTLYNGSNYRVTEVFVRLSRLEGDDFVDRVALSRLVPPSGDMGAGIAGMMNQVAPDRKKAGVNPLDTGPFEAEVGPQPEAYRWRIEGARGYAFRPGG
jgi:hypothetical protein